MGDEARAIAPAPTDQREAQRRRDAIEAQRDQVLHYAAEAERQARVAEEDAPELDEADAFPGLRDEERAELEAAGIAEARRRAEAEQLFIPAAEPDAFQRAAAREGEC